MGEDGDVVGGVRVVVVFVRKRGGGEEGGVGICGCGGGFEEEDGDGEGCGGHFGRAILWVWREGGGRVEGYDVGWGVGCRADSSAGD